ncbi:MAG: diversity-generating retroelement protein Avd [Alcaligenaceae bacterium]|nr:diversity-generating retroelement protein Avd [Alcaligenaceae bacterium]
MSGSVNHDGAGESPLQTKSPKQPTPHEALLAKLEELEAYTHKALQQYPRIERHLLCSQIQTSMNIIQRLTIVGWKRYHKKTTLQDLDVEVEILRKWLTKSLRLEYINAHKYATWMNHVNEVGRMVGGWLRSAG